MRNLRLFVSFPVIVSSCIESILHQLSSRYNTAINSSYSEPCFASSGSEGKGEKERIRGSRYVMPNLSTSSSLTTHQQVDRTSATHVSSTTDLRRCSRQSKDKPSVTRRRSSLASGTPPLSDTEVISGNSISTNPWRPASALAYRHSPSLYQPSQRVEPALPLKRRFYHLGVYRTAPPPGDVDLSYWENSTTTTSHSPAPGGGASALESTETIRRVSDSTASRSPSNAGKTVSPQPQDEQLYIAYKPFSSFSPPRRPHSGQSLRGNQNSAGVGGSNFEDTTLGLPPPRAILIPPVEENRHFVHPHGPKSSMGGSDWSNHFISRPNYSFVRGNESLALNASGSRPSSAASVHVAGGMMKALWRVQRDQAAEWVPSHKLRSAVAQTPSTAMAIESTVRATSAVINGMDAGEEEDSPFPKSGSFNGTRSSSSPVVRRSIDVVRCASAAYATRMARLERKMRNSVTPETWVHPNQVYVQL
jgi:hypothetical protein